MRIWMVSCSAQGTLTMRRLRDALTAYGQRAENTAASGFGKETMEIETAVKCSALPEISEKRSLSELTGEQFRKADALIFICAAGIAVRSIAPFIGHKSEDPAVLVMDESGQFCISLLSGHMGGANDLAQLVGKLLGAQPVITTASDTEGRFSADTFARRNGLVPENFDAVKKLAVRILSGETIGIYSEFPISGEMPPQLVWREELRTADIVITSAELPADAEVKERGRQQVILHPQITAVGLGCRRGTTKEEILEAVQSLGEILEKKNISRKTIFGFASIDLKQNETGLLEACVILRRECSFYSAEKLNEIPGEFAESAFVRNVTGTSNVCERSACALAASQFEKYELIVPKQIFGRVTCAAAVGVPKLTWDPPIT